MRKLNILSLLGLLLALLLAGCSNEPSANAIRQQITAQLLDNHRDQIYEVKNFKKINGWHKDDYVYVAKVNYDLLYKTDLAGAMRILQGENGSMFAGGLNALALGMAYGDFKAGDIRHFSEEYAFMKTEKGWMLKPQ